MAYHICRYRSRDLQNKNGEENTFLAVLSDPAGTWRLSNERQIVFRLTRIKLFSSSLKTILG